MSSVQNLFQQSQLAEAAYAKFDLFPNDPIAALKATGFSASQATEFASQWRVVDHIPNTNTGFSATAFERLSNGAGTGEFNLAIRGSVEPINDFVDADANDIFLNGMAQAQFVDLYNYWQRLSTPSNGTYAAAKLVVLEAESLALRAAYALPVVGSIVGAALEAVFSARADIIIDHGLNGVTVRTIQFVDSSTLTEPNLQHGAGFQGDILALSTSGHSLGGHLAMAFTRLFPGTNASATAFSGLGFRLNNNVAHLFALLGGNSSFDAAKNYNVYGLAGPVFAAQNTPLLTQIGGYQGIYIESIDVFDTALGHKTFQLTDSLAVYDVFAKLDPTFNTSDPAVAIGKITEILLAASAQSSDTLERTVNALVNFFELDFVPLTGALIDNREELYKRVVPLQALLTNSTLTLNLLTTATATDLANIAQGSEAFGYRYALNPPPNRVGPAQRADLTK